MYLLLHRKVKGYIVNLKEFNLKPGTHVIVFNDVQSRKDTTGYSRYIYTKEQIKTCEMTNEQHEIIVTKKEG